MSRPRLLDLFCGAGGAAVGYHRAGFEVVGVDLAPQPRYPFLFCQGDALDFLRRNGRHFDAIHASPPCQAYTRAAKQWRVSGRLYPDLVAATRDLLYAADRPFVIENVPGAPLVEPVTLCGTMFGLGTYRHRLFEASVYLTAPPHFAHTLPLTKMGRPPKAGEMMHIAGHFAGVPEAQKAMGIDWMGQKDLAQAIPPAYTEFIGKQLLRIVQAARKEAA